MTVFQHLLPILYTLFEKLAQRWFYCKDIVDSDFFAAPSDTESLPFKPGKQGHLAVKVIDPRGNEAMRVMRME